MRGKEICLVLVAILILGSWGSAVLAQEAEKSRGIRIGFDFSIKHFQPQDERLTSQGKVFTLVFEMEGESSLEYTAEQMRLTGKEKGVPASATIEIHAIRLIKKVHPRVSIGTSVGNAFITGDITDSVPLADILARISVFQRETKALVSSTMHLDLSYRFMNITSQIPRKWAKAVDSLNGFGIALTIGLRF